MTSTSRNAPAIASSALRHLRAQAPHRIVSVLSNCGGTNWASGRFAGNLADGTISEEEFTAICHALIFPNGVRKTTKRGRNTAVFRDLVDTGALTLPAAARVLDIGASGGLDALATLDLLSQRSVVSKYMLGDLYTCVLYDRERGLVFDEDHNLLQVRRGRSFVSVNFSYNFDFQRLTNLPKRIRPWLLRRRYAYRAGPNVVRLPLAHPQLAIDSPGSPFQLRRMNVFEPIADVFDLVICMHLLVPRYFAPQQIEAGIRNLSAAVAIGGSLVVGAAEDFRVIRRVGTSELEERRFP